MVLNGKKIIVKEGAGFIGRNIAGKLLSINKLKVLGWKPVHDSRSRVIEAIRSTSGTR